MIDQIKTAVDILNNHGIIIIPTDTLYGLVCKASDSRAVSKIFNLKGRSKNLPLPLMLANADDLMKYARSVPDIVWPLVENFWPGPLTIVLKKSSSISDIITGGLNTVALRVPNHVVPRTIVKELGQPITGTSANLSGGTNITRPEEIYQTFGESIDMVITHKEKVKNQASTILDISTGNPRILRNGVISRNHIEAVLGNKIDGD